MLSRVADYHKAVRNTPLEKLKTLAKATTDIDGARQIMHALGLTYGIVEGHFLHFRDGCAAQGDAWVLLFRRQVEEAERKVNKINCHRRHCEKANVKEIELEENTGRVFNNRFRSRH